MKQLGQTFLSLTLVLVFSPDALRADENKETNVDQTKIEAWIEQLDADSLTKRQEARKQLTKAGQIAIPALAKAALSDKRDVIAHSIDILSEIVKNSEDAEAKKAANVVLETLAESEKPSTAQRAKLALEAKKDNGIQAFPGWDKPGSEFAGGGLGRNVNRRVSVSNFNGVKTISITEAGTTTVLQDEPSGAIRVRITGGEKPKEFVAKNLDDLKKKDPAVHALYQQHAGSARVNVFGMSRRLGGFGRGAVFGPGGAFANGANLAGNPAFGNAQGVVGNAAGGNAANQLMIQQLTDLKNRMAGNALMQQMLDQQIKELQPQKPEKAPK